ncbi:sugar ABC transporter permease [Paenibacillus sp. SC116]|uniref:carbohydrate ABC transporter permease n=1 Tax=Paenibacillus sp. SC116 TaxID=2968986 RepID=UPI00215A160F|nr:sugar ABC transporter permease [Paenibacillus sp. SC116]MCR8844515.1 sugar ABC transporter permease [Paenibacillus sp. SC116]
MLRRLVRKQGFIAIGFLAPSIVGFAMFYVIPFGVGILYSVMDQTSGGEFVGATNYENVLASASFRKAAMNTLQFTAVSVPILILLSLLLALILNGNVYVKRWLRTAFVLPLVVPVASIVMVWQIVFDWNGSLNAWMAYLGWERIDWMKSDWAIGVLTLVYVWKNLGYNMILFLAGLQSVPKDYYETADIEGASPIHKLFHITLVYLTPTMFFVVLISIINSFHIFRATYLIAGDYPHDSIYMLQHYMNNMFASLDVQKLTAAAVMMVVCILIIVSSLLALERRFNRSME